MSANVASVMNPVPMMGLVELIRNLATGAGTVATAGLTPVSD